MHYLSPIPAPLSNLIAILIPKSSFPPFLLLPAHPPSLPLLPPNQSFISPLTTSPSPPKPNIPSPPILNPQILQLPINQHIPLLRILNIPFTSKPNDVSRGFGFCAAALPDYCCVEVGC